MEKGIKYIGPVWDSSGYAKATRNNILSLYKEGVSIKVEPHCFETVQTSVGSPEDRAVFGELVKNEMEYDITISQLTPDMAMQHIETNKYNIAYFAWESTVVHPKWVECLNTMDEVWVPSYWVLKSLKNSGVVKPITKVPHSIDTEMFDRADSEYVSNILPVSEDTFLFYSMFQWQPRKNPEILLRSYFNAFSSKDDVGLVLKTYIHNGTQQEQSAIADKVQLIKRDMLLPFDEYPKVFLIGNKISDDQVAALHLRSDCCVSVHASEGWGLVPFEAGLAGNPVIATGASGNMEFMNEHNSYPIDFQWEYVNGMSTFNGWYLGSGQWAAPDQIHASVLMRHVFDNRDEASEKGALLREEIKQKYSHKKIAQLMKARIMEIRREIL